MPRRRRLRHRSVPGASSGMVFAHGGRRSVVTRDRAVPPLDRADLAVGRTTTLVDRLRLHLRRRR